MKDSLIWVMFTSKMMSAGYEPSGLGRWGAGGRERRAGASWAGSSSRAEHTACCTDLIPCLTCCGDIPPHPQLTVAVRFLG